MFQKMLQGGSGGNTIESDDFIFYNGTIRNDALKIVGGNIEDGKIKFLTSTAEPENGVYIKTSLNIMLMFKALNNGIIQIGCGNDNATLPSVSQYGTNRTKFQDINVEAGKSYALYLTNDNVKYVTFWTAIGEVDSIFAVHSSFYV